MTSLATMIFLFFRQDLFFLNEWQNDCVRKKRNWSVFNEQRFIVIIIIFGSLVAFQLYRSHRLQKHDHSMIFTHQKHQMIFCGFDTHCESYSHRIHYVDFTEIRKIKFTHFFCIQRITILFEAHKNSKRFSSIQWFQINRVYIVFTQ